jgi:flagellar assembly protein FliH
MHSSSRIVFAEDLVGAAPWQPGVLAAERRSGLERRADGRDAAPRDFEAGVREGFQRGVRHAREQLEPVHAHQAAELAARADALLGALTEQIASLQQSLADDVTELAVEIARSAVGATLRIRGEVIGPVVAEALTAIVEEHGKPVVRLHPDDLARVGDRLGALLAARDVELVSDPSLRPGGCVVDTARASVDATVQTRWRRALQAIGRGDEWIDA